MELDVQCAIVSSTTEDQVGEQVDASLPENL